MPRKARVNHNFHYMGPQPPAGPYGAAPGTPMPKPQWTYRTKGTLIFPDLKCGECGGVLPGGRRLCNLFTPRCRCDGGVDDASSASEPSYVQTADSGVYYTWNPKPVRVVELFRPNPLPELPESFKRIRAADERAAKRRTTGNSRGVRSPIARSPSRSQHLNTSSGLASDEPAITFHVEDARHRLQHVRYSTSASEPLHPFLDRLLDVLDDVASDRPRPRTRKPASAWSYPGHLSTVDGLAQSAAIRPVSPTARYPSPPLTPPRDPPGLMTPAQPPATHVPSPRVPPSSARRYSTIPRDPVAEPRFSPDSSSPGPNPESEPRTIHQPVHRDTTLTPRSILRNTRRDTERQPTSHLPSPRATPRSPPSALHDPDASFAANPRALRAHRSILGARARGSGFRTV